MGKNILFISYYSPPNRTVASNRIYNIIEQLIEHGHSITLITPDIKYFKNIDKKYLNFPNLRVEYTGYFLYSISGESGKIISRALSKILRILGIEPCIGWMVSLIQKYIGINKDTYFDFVFISGGPFISFIPLLLLDNIYKNKINFILDYRDLWTDNPHNTIIYPIRFLFEKIEKKLLKKAKCIFAVSPSIKDILIKKYLIDSNKVYVLTNGFNIKDFNIGTGLSTNKKNKVFNIVYAGTFYKDLGEIDPVFSALKELKNKYRYDFIFDYYGSQENYVKEKGKIYGLLDNIRCYGLRDRDEVLNAIVNADCALVIINSSKYNDDEKRGIITGKLFECIALNPNTLVIAPEDSDVNIILSDIGYDKSIYGLDIDGIINRIKYYINNPRRSVNKEAILKYSWNVLGDQLNDYITKCI